MSVRLLVSVRSAAEAEQALAGGAALIDVKEPSLGPMGRADDFVVEDVLQTVAGRRPVSAALGELRTSGDLTTLPRELSYVKFGLARCAAWRHWESAVQMLCLGFLAVGRSARIILAAYADSEKAKSPPLEKVADFVCKSEGGFGLLVDTFTKKRGKNRPTLLDWADEATLGRLCERCHTASVPVALAGSLGVAEVRRLVPLGPDWIGVRGAVCAGHDRNQSVDAKLVQEIAALVNASN
jgi:uncharacterized protein (UPF0264 family)